MRTYKKYIESNIEWIGQIPHSWEAVMVKRLTQVKRGASPRPIDDPKYFDDSGEYSWVRIADVSKSNKYLYKTKQKLSALGADFSVKMNPDEIFLSIAGSVGKPIIPKIKCCIHDGFVYFPNLEINIDFFYSILFLGQCFQGLGKFGTQLNLNSETVGLIHIPLPPLPEQKAIATYLDEKTTLIDALIEKTEKKIELLKEQRTAIINQAVTKGLDPKAKMKDSGVEWIGEIPEGWEMIPLKLLIEDLESGVSVNSYASQKVVGKEIGILKTSCVFNLKFEPDENKKVVEAEVERVTCQVRKGRIIISRMNTPQLVGASGLVKKDADNLYLPDRLWQTVYSEIEFSRKWLSYALICDSIRHSIMGISTGTSSSMKNITKGNFLSLKVPFPPLNTQTDIVRKLEFNLNSIDEIGNILSKKLSLVKEYRQALISEVVTGKICVLDEIPEA